MRYVEVGGAKLSAIGVGAGSSAPRDWGYGNDVRREDGRGIVRRALDLGINLFDTAELYGFGRSEKILGAALAGKRDDAFIATKFLPVMPLASIVEQSAKASSSGSGRTSSTSTRCTGRTPSFPMTAVDRHAPADGRRPGQHAGVSNYPADRWRRAEDALGGPILSNQVRFSLDRGPPEKLVPFAQSEGRIVMAYSPLGQGLLGGRTTRRTARAGWRDGRTRCSCRRTSNERNR